MQTNRARIRAATRAQASSLPFGPSFFLGELRAYVRQQCPASAEALPIVHVHAAGGEILDLCHVIGLSPAWVALSVWDHGTRAGEHNMRTELVPYGAIHRVTVRSQPASAGRIGFDLDRPLVRSATADQFAPQGSAGATQRK